MNERSTERSGKFWKIKRSDPVISCHDLIILVLYLDGYLMLIFSNNDIIFIRNFYGNLGEVNGLKFNSIGSNICPIDPERELDIIARLRSGNLEARISLDHIGTHGVCRRLALRSYETSASRYRPCEFIHFPLGKVPEAIEYPNHDGRFLTCDKNIGRRSHFYLGGECRKYGDSRKSPNTTLIGEFEAIHS